MDFKSTIWERVALGDKQAYAELFRSLYKRLYNYGLKFTNDETIVEDVAQETLLVIWQKRKHLLTVDFPETYSFSVFRNTLFTRLKKHQRYISGAEIDAEPEFGIDHIMISRETDRLTKEKIKTAIASLTSRQREAIFLRFYEGLAYDEVAQMLGITTKATYKIIARALDELRQSLQIPGSMLLVLLMEVRAEKYF